jgi:hypothetical protein
MEFKDGAITYLNSTLDEVLSADQMFCCCCATGWLLFLSLSAPERIRATWSETGVCCSSFT